MKNGQTRYNNYDLLRIISTIAVIFIHVNYQYFRNYSDTPSLSILYIIESLINIIMRFSVPAFVMISGAFNLNIKNANAGEFYKKTTWKIFVPSFGAIILFLIIDEGKAILIGTSKFSPIKSIITGGYYNLWFLYMLAGLYLLTPLLVKMKQSISKKSYAISAAILMIWAVGSQAVSSERVAYAIGVVFAFLGYYVLGDVILNDELQLNYKKGLYFTVASIMFLITFIIRYMGVSYYLFNAYTNFFSPTIVIASICIFAGFKQIDVKRDLSWLSGKTLYIYLFHAITYRAIFKLLGNIQGSLELIAIPAVVVMTFAVALGIAIIYDRYWKSRTAWKNKWYSMDIWNKIE